MSRDALVVGLNSYQYLPRLQAPAQDAESVARCFENFGECRTVRLPETIVDQKPTISERSAVTTAALEAALIKLFKPAGKTVPQTAIFYYSGHGLQRHAGIQEGYLATSDANPAAGHYGLSLHWLRRLLQESPVPQRVILLDCCNSGEFFNMLEADPGARAGTDRLFMAAAREYESAYEALGSNHSVFTQALLLGLNPHSVKGGIVNGHSLTDVVNRELKSELQQPLFESSGGEIVLTRTAGASAQAASPPLLERLQKLRCGFCPFPGTAPFELAHSDFFFGRDDFTQTLTNRVQSSRLCVLLGASGTGKTSLLRAGLMPHLACHTGAWDVRYLALSAASPLASLAEVFVEPELMGLPRAEQLHRAETFLRQGAEGVCQLVKALVGERGPRRLVLILDQFEALLAPGFGSDRDRRLIIDCLTAAVEQEHLPLHLVLALRSHHLADLADAPTFQSLVAAHSLSVPPMTYSQLKATIVGPLDRTGFRYDANLVYTLLLDVVSAPADLALLQMTLRELWLRRQQGPDQEPSHLTLTAYVEMGGVRHLLSQRADDLYQRLSAAEQAIAQRIFLGLCELGDGQAITRRTVSLPELVTTAMPEQAVVATLEKLLAARLMVAQTPLPEPIDPVGIAVPRWSSSQAIAESSPSGLTPTLLLPPPSLLPTPSILTLPDGYPKASEVVDLPAAASEACFDIAHEALIRNWPLLQQWQQQQGSVVRQQRGIEMAAQEWQLHQQPSHPDYFLTKTRLGEATSFQQAHGEYLSLLASGYLEACDRYAKRCRRQRHLVRLLIPLSMATGMLTAYGHSYIAQPAKLALAKATSAPVSSTVPAFIPAASGEDNASPATPAAMRPDVLMATLPSPPPQAQRQMALRLQSTLNRVAKGMASSSQLDPAASLSLPTASSSTTHQPSANQVVELESRWISPNDPSVVIQIWCTRTEPEPVCFTTTATRK
ncbi:MAG: caspase family protein [Nodosilinea sp.]